MHNIKDIRNDFENFKERLKNRNIDISLDNILSLDGENRKLIQEKEKFEMEKKSISKSKDQSLFEKSKELSLKIEEINKNQIKLQSQITEILSSIPDFNDLRDKLELKYGLPEQSEISWIPENYINLDEEKSLSMLKFLEALDNCEDVQNVFGNFNLDPKASEKFN